MTINLYVDLRTIVRTIKYKKNINIRIYFKYSQNFEKFNSQKKNYFRMYKITSLLITYILNQRNC